MSVRHRRSTVGLAAAATLAVAAALFMAVPAAARTGDASRSAAPPAGERQQAFARAARATGVPAAVLLAVAYNESRWEEHGGAPSTTGAYGVMALTDLPAAAPTAKGDGRAVPRSARTLTSAADLAGVTGSAARTDDAANISAGGALLAHDARSLGHGRLPSTVAGWYGAVAAYADTPARAAATTFADDVYATIRTGAARTTADGQALTLAAEPHARPDTGSAAGLHLRAAAPAPKAECPPDLRCNVVPAAYQSNDPQDKTKYGNYDLADRPHTMRIDHIVLHDTEETYPSTLNTFTNPANSVSAHYVIRSSDGLVTQMVPTRDVAWQAGNWYVNVHSIGIEQEGFAVQGAQWFTEPLYRSSARLVRYLAARFGVPLDRQHIIGHDNVPGTTPATVAGMHWDPGPFWDWGHYLALLGRPIRPTGGPGSPVVTIDPVFAHNAQTVTDCEVKPPAPVPAQASSFVYLHTGPDATSPLVSDPALHASGPGTSCAADWGDKASAGQQFVVADRQPGWTAIWWDGVKAWFADPAGGDRASVPSSSAVVVPKPGRDSVAVYGRAYPEASAYPAAIPVQDVVPLQYVIQPGQAYVTTGPVPTDYYYAKTIDSSLPGDHTDVVGHDRYLEIQLGHRIGFVKADDVDVRPAG